MNDRHHMMRGTVWHHRHSPVVHRFAYPLSLVLADLSDLDGLLDRHGLWGRARRPVTLRDRDFIDDSDQPLIDKVRRQARALGLPFEAGRVLMLAQPRGLGWLFNPLVLYFHLPDRAEAPDAVLAEVSNTPWGERYFYGHAWPEPSQTLSFTHDKAFHVSPFLPMNMRYQWDIHWEAPLRLSIEAWQGDDKVFQAGMRLAASPATAGTMKVLPFARQAFLTSLRIYGQAFRLWWRRFPLYPHPRKTVMERR